MRKISLKVTQPVLAAMAAMRGIGGPTHLVIERVRKTEGYQADLERFGGNVRLYHRLISCLVRDSGASRCGWTMSRCLTNGRLVRVVNWRY